MKDILDGCPVKDVNLSFSELIIQGKQNASATRTTTKQSFVEDLRLFSIKWSWWRSKRIRLLSSCKFSFVRDGMGRSERETNRWPVGRLSILIDPLDEEDLALRKASCAARFLRKSLITDDVVKSFRKISMQYGWSKDTSLQWDDAWCVNKHWLVKWFSSSNEWRENCEMTRTRSKQMSMLLLTTFQFVAAAAAAEDEEKKRTGMIDWCNRIISLQLRTSNRSVSEGFEKRLAVGQYLSFSFHMSNEEREKVKF